MMNFFFLFFSFFLWAQDYDSPSFEFEEGEFENSLESDDDFLNETEDWGNESFDDDGDWEDELLEENTDTPPVFSDTKPEPPKSEEVERLQPQRRTRTSKEDKRGRYIYHPNQDKGLYKINKNGQYLYKYEKSELVGFYHIKAGSYQFGEFAFEEGTSNYEDFYDSDTAFTLSLEYDWPIFKKMQSLSLSFNGGVAYARGNGAFVDAGVTQTSGQAREKYNLIFLPLGVGLTYKFKFISNQLFLPYVNGSLNYNLMVEYRESFEALKYLGIFGAHFSGGLAINLGWFERMASLQLDYEYGINNTYLSFEARQVVSFEDDNDISGLVFLAGLSFEY